MPNFFQKWALPSNAKKCSPNIFRIWYSSWLCSRTQHDHSSSAIPHQKPSVDLLGTSRAHGRARTENGLFRSVQASESPSTEDLASDLETNSWPLCPHGRTWHHSGLFSQWLASIPHVQLHPHRIHARYSQRIHEERLVVDLQAGRHLSPLSQIKIAPEPGPSIVSAMPEHPSWKRCWQHLAWAHLIFPEAASLIFVILHLIITIIHQSNHHVNSPIYSHPYPHHSPSFHLHPASQAFRDSSSRICHLSQPGLTAKRIIKCVHNKLNEIDPERWNVHHYWLRECQFPSILTGETREVTLISIPASILTRLWRENSELMSKTGMCWYLTSKQPTMLSLRAMTLFDWSSKIVYPWIIIFSCINQSQEM